MSSVKHFFLICILAVATVDITPSTFSVTFLNAHQPSHASLVASDTSSSLVEYNQVPERLQQIIEIDDNTQEISLRFSSNLSKVWLRLRSDQRNDLAIKVLLPIKESCFKKLPTVGNQMSLLIKQEIGNNTCTHNMLWFTGKGFRHVDLSKDGFHVVRKYDNSDDEAYKLSCSINIREENPELLPPFTLGVSIENMDEWIANWASDEPYCDVIFSFDDSLKLGDGPDVGGLTTKISKLKLFALLLFGGILVFTGFIILTVALID